MIPTEGKHEVSPMIALAYTFEVPSIDHNVGREKAKPGMLTESRRRRSEVEEMKTIYRICGEENWIEGSSALKELQKFA